MKNYYELQYYDTKTLEWREIHKTKKYYYLKEWLLIYKKECPNINYRIVQIIEVAK